MGGETKERRKYEGGEEKSKREIKQT